MSRVGIYSTQGRSISHELKFDIMAQVIDTQDVLDRMEGPGLSDRRRTFTNACASIRFPIAVNSRTTEVLTGWTKILNNLTDSTTTSPFLSRQQTLYMYIENLLRPGHERATPLEAVLLKTITREVKITSATVRRGESKETVMRNTISSVVGILRTDFDKVLKKASNFDTVLERNAGVLSCIKDFDV